jgi:Fe-S-cluster containining protein
MRGSLARKTGRKRRGDSRNVSGLVRAEDRGSCWEMPVRRQTIETSAALAEVRAVYAELEARPVERACIRRTECCKFKLTGSTPLVTKGEALLAGKALRAAGRKKLPEPLDPVAGSCPMLNAQGKCIIYQDRPFGCRTHFCEAAGGPYSRREVLDLIRRLEHVDALLAGDGSHGFEQALNLALIELEDVATKTKR